MGFSLFISAAAFLAGFLAIFAVNLLITDLFLNERAAQRKRLEAEQRERLKERVRQVAGTKNLEQLAAAASSESEERKNAVEQLKELIEQAGLDFSAGRLLLTSLMLAFGLGGLTGALTHNIPIAGIVCFGVFWVPIFYVRYKRGARLEKLRAQMPDALELMSRILRAGQTMSQAMMAVAGEFKPPVGTEFSFCYEQQNLGLSPEIALRALGKRTGVIEVQIFVLALLVHRRAGGNLAELLDKLSTTIRERYKIRGKVKSMTAEGRLQAVALLILPPAMFLLLLLVNRPYAVKLFDHPGLIAISLVSMAVGAVWIRKIVNFDF